MNDALQRIYDATPEEPPLSRLEPFKELILRWRRDHRSLPAICRLLKIQCGVQITREPLRKYILRRTRKGKVTVGPEAVVTPPVAASARDLPAKRAASEIASMRLAARASNYSYAAATKEYQELFVFDESAPLINHKQKENK